MPKDPREREREREMEMEMERERECGNSLHICTGLFIRWADWCEMFI